MKDYELKCLAGTHPRILVTEEFVTKNNLTLARTPEEIMQRMKDNRGLFDFSSEILVEYLPWEMAKASYKEEYQKEVDSGTKTYVQITDLYEGVQDMLDYMVFGWMKALDQRGISASRTINKVAAWLWLFGRDDLRRLVEDDDIYNPYGAPALIELNKALGIESPEDLIAFAQVKC